MLLLILVSLEKCTERSCIPILNFKAGLEVPEKKNDWITKI